MSEEVFYVMATRHRERLSIHMLESERANLLVRAGQNIPKLHGWDLTDAPRAGEQPTSKAMVRLQASKEKFLALMQKERGRFVEVMAGSVRMAMESPAVRTGVHRVWDTGVTLHRILQHALTMQGFAKVLSQSPISKGRANSQTEQLTQRR